MLKNINKSIIYLFIEGSKKANSPVVKLKISCQVSVLGNNSGNTTGNSYIHLQIFTYCTKTITSVYRQL